MKMIYVLGLLMTIALPASAGETCVALDYQEMKEMKKEALVKEYCSAHLLVLFYHVQGEFNSTMGDMQSKLAAVGRGATKREYEVAASKSNADSVKSYGISEQCKSQRNRIGRVLAQSGDIDEAALQTDCEEQNRRDKLVGRRSD